MLSRPACHGPRPTHQPADLVSVCTLKRALIGDKIFKLQHPNLSKRSNGIMCSFGWDHELQGGGKNIVAEDFANVRHDVSQTLLMDQFPIGLLPEPAASPRSSIYLYSPLKMPFQCVILDQRQRVSGVYAWQCKVQGSESLMLRV